MCQRQGFGLAREMGKVRVAVVVDMPLFRDGIVQALAAVDNFAVLTYGRSGSDDLQLSVRPSIDVLIVELETAKGSFELIEKLAAFHPNTSILILGATGDPHIVVTALKGGVRGYALRSVSGHDLIEAVRQLASGNSYVAPGLAAALLGGTGSYSNGHSGTATEAFSTLTPREVDIVPFLTKGYSNKEIARTLGLSEKTVKYHLTHLLRKLGARNRVEAALIASNQSRVDGAPSPHPPPSEMPSTV